MSSQFPGTATALVAIIDDDEDIREALGALLSSLGYAALLYATAGEFLVSGAATKVACVISDIQIPGMGGLEVARLMRVAGIPVILITAFQTPVIERHAKAAGVRRLLVKPFDSGELIMTLDALLGQ